jgi:MFS family permease
MTDPTPTTDQRWLTPGVRGIGAASFLADVGHEIPTALLPNLLTATLGAPAAALGLIEGIADGLAGATRLAGGAIADDPQRRRAQAVAGYTTTAVLSSLIGAATTVWQVAVLRAGAWAARGLRVPARNALLADIVPASVYRPRLRVRAGHGQPRRHRRPPSRPGPGRPGRHPHRHRPVHHPRPARRPGHRLRHPPRPPG